MESDADPTGGSLAGWLRFSTLAADLIADFCLVVVIKPAFDSMVSHRFSLSPNENSRELSPAAQRDLGRYIAETAETLSRR